MIANKLNIQKSIIPSSLFPTQDAAMYPAGFGFGLSMHDHRRREADPVEACRRLDPEEIALIGDKAAVKIDIPGSGDLFIPVAARKIVVEGVAWFCVATFADRQRQSLVLLRP